HLKHDNREPRDLVIRTVMGMNGSFDWDRFRGNHGSYCAYQSRRGWDYSKLTFLGWIRAGYPPPPPEPEVLQSGAEARRRRLENE
ncbi:MAG TPA: hypothetical protein VHB50_14315, partial [Bryobacteraceae bacterium]|nr:hypothetical protein [Bryobacteraceae bacterium]